MNTEEQFVIDLSKHTETVRPYSILEKEDFYTEQYKKMDTTYAEKHFLVTIGKDSQFLHWIEKNYRYMKIMKVAEYYHLYNGSKKGHKVGGFIGFMAVADKKLPALVPKNMTFYASYLSHTFGKKRADGVRTDAPSCPTAPSPAAALAISIASASSSPIVFQIITLC
jgi:hypothetical protein